MRSAREVRCGCRLPKYQSNPIGSGTPSDPFHICSVSQLVAAIPQPTANFVLESSLNLQDSAMTPLGNSADFSGTFDGLSYPLLNFNSVSAVINAPVGFFAVITGTVKNVVLQNISINTSANATGVGALVGKLNGTVLNSSAIGVVTGGAYLGGLIGIMPTGASPALVQDSTSRVAVTTSNAGSVGGLIGQFDNGSIIHCSALGNITSSNQSASGTGGFVGLMGSNTAISTMISRSMASGTVNGSNILGGFAGQMVSGTIQDSYATGGVTTTTTGAAVGGLFGILGSGSTSPNVTNLYSSTASLGGGASSNVGGFFGKSSGAPVVANVYSNKAGFQSGSGNQGAALSSSQLQKQSSYSGFDFTNTWILVGDDSTPTLR